MNLDFSDTNTQRPEGVIPPGTFALCVMQVIPGGASLPNHPVPSDEMLFTKAKDETSNTLILKYKVTILFGPWARRQIFGQFIIAGGKTDDKGVSLGWNVSKDTIRAILDSARGIDPDDNSSEAKAKRHLDGFYTLNELQFAIKIGVERDPTGQYNDKNMIDRIIVPGDLEYEALMTGQDIPPDPHGRVRMRKVQGAGNGAAGPSGGVASWQDQHRPRTAAPATRNQWDTARVAQPTAPMHAQQATPIPPLRPVPPMSTAQAPAPVQPGAGPNWLNGQKG